MILAIETATDVCSVAFENNAAEIFEKRTVAPGAHSEKLFAFIQELMSEHSFSVADLKAVLVSEGPGSYTGLRIAASGVKGLLFDSEVPLYGIATLASFAVAAQKEEPGATKIHAIIDARRVHLYHQAFTVREGSISASGEAEIIPIKSFENMVQPRDVIIGTGMDRININSQGKLKCFDTTLISARSLIQLFHRKETGDFMKKVWPGRFDPNYYTSRQG